MGAAALQLSSWLSGREHPSLSDFSAALLAVALISFLCAPAALIMPRDAGAELSGQRRPRAA
jgi:hypothetical protein